MKIECLQVAQTIGDLAGLPVGVRIATAHGKVMERDEAWDRGYWIEPGTLSPYFEPLVHWLPCVILPRIERQKPPARDYKVADIMHAGFLKPGDVLVSNRKDSEPSEATVGDGGELIVGGESYDSPTGAALATLAHRFDGVNGWKVWHDKEGRFLFELRQLTMEME